MMEHSTTSPMHELEVALFKFTQFTPVLIIQLRLIFTGSGSPAEQSRPRVLSQNNEHRCTPRTEATGPESVEELNSTRPRMPPSESAYTPNFGAPVSQCYSETDYHPPQQFDLSPPLVPHTPYLPCHQRSYGSNPEVTETHTPSLYNDYLTRSRWSPYVPQCCWWLQPTIEYPPPTSWLSQFGQDPLNMPISQFPAASQETCPCTMEVHQLNSFAYWHKPQLSGPSCGSVSRGQDNARFITHMDPARVPPSSTAIAMDAGFPGGYGLPEGTQCAPAQWDYPICTDRTPFIYHGPPRGFNALSPSPTYDSVMWNAAASWNPRMPYWHTPFSPYHFRMPRSGSAGAGFGCALDTSGVNNPSSTGLIPQRGTRERSVGPDLTGLQNPMQRSAHRCLNPVYHAQPNHPMGRGSTELSPPTRNSPTVSLSGVRTMSNSLSANDLSGYRSKHAIEMRSTKSNFELTPELPCEPALALIDFTDFYSKVAAFIEMDNNMQLTVPNGWSERRSSFGRCYYACDQTKQATWNHPTIGLYVPLGWERVDSCHDGIFYRNLLIPHCQRHHPNLWLHAPPKDPNVEREAFFSDLRHLQSSLRHEINFELRELESYKNTALEDEEKAFLTIFNQLDVNLMVETTRVLDQLFYQELHALVVLFEQERLRIASALFRLQYLEES